MYEPGVKAGVLVLVALVCAVALPLSGTSAQAAAAGESANGGALQSVMITLDETWNGRDARRFSELFTEDGSLQFVDRGYFLEGRDAIHRHFAKQFPATAPDIRHLTTVREIRDIAAEVCTVDAKVEILHQGPELGAEPTVIRTFSIIAVMLQTGDSWSIRVLRAYQMPAASGESADS